MRVLGSLTALLSTASSLSTSSNFSAITGTNPTNAQHVPLLVAVVQQRIRAGFTGKGMVKRDGSH